MSVPGRSQTRIPEGSPMSDTAQNPPPDAAPAPGKDRRWALAAAVGVIAGGTGAALAWRHFSLEEPDIQDIWQQRFASPEGAPIALADLKGRPLLVNFWATWCPPCVQELPLLSRFYTQVKHNGWQMLGLAIDQTESVQRFLARAPVSFPVAMAGPSGVELTRKLGNAAGGLPFTVIFDRTGQVQHRKLGQLKEADLIAWLR